ncbi:hypothetical protein [Amycolatopsis sp.]|uniref:hypothetical protein n=1 Tax=Amycolatopsis sp. TaxID=37632 RepID=UPI002D7E805D|nr:hypothetical protein [Amycolatopsis sp.]HET6704390.1 hypothetical protein [Amycolatopsis sp.]
MIQRCQAENSSPPDAPVRASVAPAFPAAPRPDRVTRWLLAGAAGVAALSAFAVISFVVSDDPEPPPVRGPVTPGQITFAGTRTVTETAAPPPPTVFSPPYGSPYGSYYEPSR